MPLSEEVTAAAQRWLAIDPDAKTRAEVEGLVAAGDEATLRARLLSGRMEFGTAGLRAAMGAGYDRMNQVTIAQSAQGLVKYLTSQFSAEDLASRGVVVGYDGRYNSDIFAQITANACIAKNVKCRLTSSVVPTPYVAFALRQFNCVAAVVVTASHNPKQDNGYKVYWANGAQIVPPHDGGIAKCIEESLDIDPATVGTAWHAIRGDCPIPAIEERFFATLQPMMERFQKLTSATPLKFTYTAMHGVGGNAVLRARDVAGLPEANFVVVKEQFSPDPEFSTVTFPNPEEGKSSLDLAIAAANAAGSTIILANDPDADRLAVAEKDAATGAWRVLTGNELGALLGWWMCEQNLADDVDFTKCVALSSTVSSQILRAYSRKFGFEFKETLTGFKWMGSIGGAAEDDEDRRIIFAFEQAIGFMCGNRVRDKDGVTALAVAVQMAAVLATQGKTLLQQLQALYAEFGAHVCSESYVTSKDPKRTMAMFDAIKGRDTKTGYPDAIGGIRVENVRDLRESSPIDTRQPDGKPTLPLSSAPMVTFYLEGGAVLTVRGSGTEPKIKWYCEAIAADVAAGQKLVDKIVDGAINEILKPEENGFVRRPE
uniref:Phosphomannomutase-like protein n=1 Tax=Neobodo designis TaxID=312471 RepID=A0A7S1MRS5_NEODS|mmetsp:Transcript_4601/g.14609  ORF Transcript_4601/g.14609 Transcript_4601/m.14609 type:complete len:599 (+) Transcript_4601:46-1842(+)